MTYTAETIKMWSDMTVEVVFDPNTGKLRPWEVYGVFTYPHARRVFWGSYKTEASANKGAQKGREMKTRIVGA